MENVPSNGQIEDENTPIINYMDEVSKDINDVSILIQFENNKFLMNEFFIYSEAKITRTFNFKESVNHCK